MRTGERGGEWNGGGWAKKWGYGMGGGVSAG
jgi:hypothetical protein